MRELIALVAGPQDWRDTRESWLDRAARRVGVSYRQIKSLFYGEITDPNHRSARLLRDAAERAAAEQEGRAEAQALVALLLSRRNSLAARDPDFYRADISALEHTLGGMGVRFSTVAVRRDQGRDDVDKPAGPRRRT